MTEAEWLKNDAPTTMFELVRECTSDRKFRLFAVSCCRELWDQIRTVPLCHAVEVAERYADGQATVAKLQAANEQTPDMDPQILDDSDLAPVERAACCVADASACQAAEFVLGHCSRVDFDIPFRILLWWRQKRRMRGFQVKIIRDIFGNPFRPVVFTPSWRTSTAVALASQLYESRDFSAMPILADALQDAGCDSADVLDHCREPGPHVRGCWVVDLVLGKE